MLKQKVKLSLIDDYISISQINKICESLIKDNLQNEKVSKFKLASDELIYVYEKLFFKIGLMDVSFLNLKKELDDVNSSSTINKLDIFEIKLKEIIFNLNIKLKKLNLTNIEIGYLTKSLVNF